MRDVNSRPADTLVMDVNWDEEGGEADCVEGGPRGSLGGELELGSKTFVKVQREGIAGKGQEELFDHTRLGEMNLEKKAQERYLPVSGSDLSPPRWNIQAELEQVKSKGRPFKSSSPPLFLCVPTTARGIWALA